MQRADSFEKTLMLGKIEGGRRRGRQRMRWLDGITDSMDMGLGGLWDLVMDREVCHAAVHRGTKSRTRMRNWLNWTEHSSPTPPWLPSLHCLVNNESSNLSSKHYKEGLLGLLLSYTHTHTHTVWARKNTTAQTAYKYAIYLISSWLFLSAFPNSPSHLPWQQDKTKWFCFNIQGLLLPDNVELFSEKHYSAYKKLL